MTKVRTRYNQAITPALIEADVIGLQDLYIAAGAMWPRTTNPCSDLTKREIAGSLINIYTLNFDATTQEYAQFSISMPRNWNNGTVTAAFEWTAASGSGDTKWELKAVALGDGDAFNTAFGTAQSVTDTLVAADTFRKTAYTSAITISNTPADLDTLYFQVSRVSPDAADTLGVDAELKGIFLTVTTDAAKAA